jgi:hypothetical protein
MSNWHIEEVTVLSEMRSGNASDGAIHRDHPNFSL